MTSVSNLLKARIQHTAKLTFTHGQRDARRREEPAGGLHEGPAVRLWCPGFENAMRVLVTIVPKL